MSYIGHHIAFVNNQVTKQMFILHKLYYSMYLLVSPICTLRLAFLVLCVTAKPYICIGSLSKTSQSVYRLGYKRHNRGITDNFFLSQIVQTPSRAQQPSYSVGTGFSFSFGKGPGRVTDHSSPISGAIGPLQKPEKCRRYSN